MDPRSECRWSPGASRLNNEADVRAALADEPAWYVHFEALMLEDKARFDEINYLMRIKPADVHITRPPMRAENPVWYQQLQGAPLPITSDEPSWFQDFLQTYEEVKAAYEIILNSLRASTSA